MGEPITLKNKDYWVCTGSKSNERLCAELHENDEKASIHYIPEYDYNIHGYKTTRKAKIGEILTDLELDSVIAERTRGDAVASAIIKTSEDLSELVKTLKEAIPQQVSAPLSSIISLEQAKTILTDLLRPIALNPVTPTQTENALSKDLERKVGELVNEQLAAFTEGFTEGYLEAQAETSEDITGKLDTTTVTYATVLEEAQSGGWQAIADEVAKRSRDTILTQLKKAKVGSTVFGATNRFLNSEWGLSLWCLGVGITLPYMPKVAKSEHALRVAQELRIGAFRHGLGATMGAVVDTILSVVSVADVSQNIMHQLNDGQQRIDQMSNVETNVVAL